MKANKRRTDSDKHYILAHDMGTSANKAVLVRTDGTVVGTAWQGYAMHQPYRGWVEQNPEDWWQAICNTTRKVIADAGVNAESIAALTIASQVMTLVAMDAEGQPLRPAMSWLDTRSASVLRKSLWTAPRIMDYNVFKLMKFLHITGGVPGHTGKDQIAKILWLKHNEPQIFHRCHKFIDAKDYIIYRFIGRYITSADIAYVWWLMDSRRKRNCWHEGLCRFAGIRPQQLAHIASSANIAGPLTGGAAKALGLQEGTPVMVGAGDLAAAAIGSGGLNEGELHVRIGSSGGAAGHFRKRKVDLRHYTGCIGSALPDQYYLGIAHQETAGLALEWLKNTFFKGLSEFNDYSDSAIFQKMDEEAATIAPGADGLMFTPWMTGERSPINSDVIRGGYHNVGLNHNRAHFIRALMEGVAYNTRWALEGLQALFNTSGPLRAIGGGARSDLWCQIFADVTGHTILQVQQPQEANARGVSLLASAALGFIADNEAIAEQVTVRMVFKPDPQAGRLYDKDYIFFKQLYKNNKRWFKARNQEVNL